MGLKDQGHLRGGPGGCQEELLGPDPNILALPKTFKVGAVHLCMKDDDLTTV